MEELYLHFSVFEQTGSFNEGDSISGFDREKEKKNLNSLRDINNSVCKYDDSFLVIFHSRNRRAETS